MRAATFAATCVLLAAVGHILMSGAPVAWPGLAVAFAVTGTAAWALTGRERGAGAVTAATVAVQAGLHSAFSLAQTVSATARPPGVSFLRQWADHLLCRTSPATAAPPAAAPSGVTTHVHGATGHGATAHAADTGLLPDTGLLAAADHAHQTAGHLAHSAMPAGHDMAAVSPTGMLAAHLLAALLCGLWLAHGERAVFRVLHAVAGRLAAPLRLVLRVPTPLGLPRVRVRRRRTTAPLRRLLLASSRGTRGPPAGTAVV
ncbi:hypothetical protein [Streptomyces sp. NPDC005805]|uniref:hypothetical protein n=1 Tax=Streptomyces sp. NPDC005805 TaxID=3157068 RepID=UPI0033CE3C1C